jgi:hypothetical protein
MGAAIFAQKSGKVFATHDGFRITMPGTNNPSIAKHIATRRSS